MGYSGELVVGGAEEPIVFVPRDLALALLGRDVGRHDFPLADVRDRTARFQVQERREVRAGELRGSDQVHRRPELRVLGAETADRQVVEILGVGRPRLVEEGHRVEEPDLVVDPRQRVVKRRVVFRRTALRVAFPGVGPPGSWRRRS